MKKGGGTTFATLFIISKRSQDTAALKDNRLQALVKLDYVDGLSLQVSILWNICSVVLLPHIAIHLPPVSVWWNDRVRGRNNLKISGYENGWWSKCCSNVLHVHSDPNLWENMTIFNRAHPGGTDGWMTVYDLNNP